MPMKPYYKETFGSYINKPWGTSSNTYGDVTRSSQASLSGVVSNVGDKKRYLAQSYTKTFVVQWNGSLYADRPISSPLVWSHLTGYVDIGTPPQPGVLSFSIGAYNNAVSQVYDQIRGNLDLSVDAAQLGQAKSMVRDTVDAVQHLATTLRKMRRAPPKKAADLWLQYQYGWKPVATSIYQTLDRLLQPEVTYVTATGRGKELSYDTSSTGAYNGIPFKRDWLNSNRCLLVVNYKIKNSRNQAISGYTSLNPVAIAWELIPYSFVVDWFVNIGGYIRNLESALMFGLDFQSGYMTQTILVTGETFCRGTSESGGIRTIANLRSGVRNSKKQRSPLVAAPWPRAPVLDVDLGVGQLTNALALVFGSSKHKY